MTVTQLTNEAVGQSLNSQLRKSIGENNSVLAGCNVHWLFRNSCIDLQTGRHGIRWLIYRILSENQAVFPRYNGQYRNVYINFSLTTQQIIDRVRAHNGFDKYPDKTILHYLGVIMSRDGQIASLRMTKEEDPASNGRKIPRKKWYLIAD